MDESEKLGKHPSGSFKWCKIYYINLVRSKTIDIISFPPKEITDAESEKIEQLRRKYECENQEKIKKLKKNKNARKSATNTAAQSNQVSANQSRPILQTACNKTSNSITSKTNIRSNRSLKLNQILDNLPPNIFVYTIHTHFDTLLSRLIVH